MAEGKDASAAYNDALTALHEQEATQEQFLTEGGVTPGMTYTIKASGRKVKAGQWDPKTGMHDFKVLE
jgi:hypothetical protein